MATRIRITLSAVPMFGFIALLEMFPQKSFAKVRPTATYVTQAQFYFGPVPAGHRLPGAGAGGKQPPERCPVHAPVARG